MRNHIVVDFYLISIQYIQSFFALCTNMGAYYGGAVRRHPKRGSTLHANHARRDKEITLTAKLPSAVPAKTRRLAKAAKHTVVRYLKFRSRRMQILEYGKHKPMEVVHKALRYFDRSTSLWTPAQHRALQAWGHWLKAWRGPSAGEKPMLEAISIISDIFFFGRLRRYVDELQNESEPADGVTYGTVKAKGAVKDMAIIELNSDDYPGRAHDMNQQLVGHVGALLHGCVHAFIQLYSCGQDCKHETCMRAFDVTEGRTGHARAWRYLACRVQRAARIVLSLDVELGICESVLLEYPEFVPQSNDWLKLRSVDLDELLQYVNDLRARSEREKKRPAKEARQGSVKALARSFAAGEQAKTGEIVLATHQGVDTGKPGSLAELPVDIDDERDEGLMEVEDRESRATVTTDVQRRETGEVTDLFSRIDI